MTNNQLHNVHDHGWSLFSHRARHARHHVDHRVVRECGTTRRATGVDAVRNVGAQNDHHDGEYHFGVHMSTLVPRLESILDHRLQIRHDRRAFELLVRFRERSQLGEVASKVYESDTEGVFVEHDVGEFEVVAEETGLRHLPQLFGQLFLQALEQWDRGVGVLDEHVVQVLWKIFADDV